VPDNSCPSSTRARARPIGRLSKNSAFTLGTCMVLVDEVFAQQGGGPPWTPAVQALQAAFTGPIATGLALVAIVVGGPMFAFGESAVQRTLTGIIFGVGIAVGAVNFVAWVFP
jgi:type IV secretion system protein TrbC